MPLKICPYAIAHPMPRSPLECLKNARKMPCNFKLAMLKYK